MEKKTLFLESSREFEKEDLPAISVSRKKSDNGDYNLVRCLNSSETSYNKTLDCMEEETHDLNETIGFSTFTGKWETSYSADEWGRTYIMRDYEKYDWYYDISLLGEGQFEIEIFDQNYHVEKSMFMVDFQREFMFVEKGQEVILFVRIDEINLLPSTSGCNNKPGYSFTQCTRVTY